MPSTARAQDIERSGFSTACKPLVVVMGVAASGKTTVGKALAARLNITYADGDDFHSAANVAKMQAGVPLDDDDRGPWLDAIGAWLHRHAKAGAVISCSALKRAYRDRLRAAAPRTRFLHLVGDIGILRRRIAARPHHFMPAALLDSQLETLEPLKADEPGIAIDIGHPPASIVDEFLAYLDRNQRR